MSVYLLYLAATLLAALDLRGTARINVLTVLAIVAVLRVAAA